jgi:hypothetical protein
MIAYKLVREYRGKRVSMFSHLGRYLKLTYPKGEIIKAKKTTLGIFVFDKRKNARDFALGYCPMGVFCLKVKPIGKGKRPKSILRAAQHTDTLREYKFREANERHISPPLGTICYPAVEVLE